MMQKLLWVVAIAVAVVLCTCNLFLGDLNQDEGWYLYGARQVSLGRLPYVDFASTQGPVMSFAYAAAQPLVDAFGLAGGRFFTAALGLAAAGLAAWLAARLSAPASGASAAFAAFCFTAVNVYQSYFCTMVKTYALTSLLLVAGFVALTFRGSRRGTVAVFLAGLLTVLAAGARSSAALCVPVVFALLVVEAVRSERRSLSWFWFGLGAAVAGCAVFGPFLVVAPRNLWFGLVEYHAAREVGGLTSLLAYKAGFVSRLVRAYFVVLGLWLITVMAVVLRKGRGGETPPRDSALTAVWLGVAAMTVVHFAAPFPYDDYQVIVLPLFAAAVAAAVVRLASSVRTPAHSHTHALCVTVLLLCVASSFSSPLNQQWLVRGADRVWWPLKKESQLRSLQRAGATLRAMAGPDRLLLTQDAYLAVESGLSLPKGLEMSPFSYYPGWSREEAEAHHVVNREMMIELIRTTPARVAAFSEWGLSMATPSITPLPEKECRTLWGELENRFETVETMDDFGQAATTLRILRRR